MQSQHHSWCYGQTFNQSAHNAALGQNSDFWRDLQWDCCSLHREILGNCWQNCWSHGCSPEELKCCCGAFWGSLSLKGNTPVMLWEKLSQIALDFTRLIGILPWKPFPSPKSRFDSIPCWQWPSQPEITGGLHFGTAAIFPLELIISVFKTLKTEAMKYWDFSGVKLFLEIIPVGMMDELWFCSTAKPWQGKQSKTRSRCLPNFPHLSFGWNTWN